MAEIRITFEKQWSVKRRMKAIQERQHNLKGCKITKMQLEKVYERVGSIEKVEKRTWEGIAEQELMLKTADYFLIEFEHGNNFGLNQPAKLNKANVSGSCQHDWYYVGTVNAEFCNKCNESRDC